MLYNKKGDVGDFVIFLAIIFLSGVSIYAGAQVWNDVSTRMDQLEVTQLPPDVQVNNSEVINDVTRTIHMFDWLYMIFFFLFYLVLLGSVFYLDTQPGYFIFAIILFLVVIFVGMALADAFTDISEDDSLQYSYDNFPITRHLMTNLPYYLMGMAMIFLLVLFASRRDG
tara:strand:- start:3622 stop:4128 length:507 start_codon:yes stop_codon:yes gene_type:complete